MKTSKQLIMRESKLLAKEVIGWKWLQHDNILPFIGVVLEPPRFSIISERMENGNVMDFIKTRPNHNRLRLVSERMGPGPDCVPTIWSAFRRRNRPKIPTRSRHHSWGFEGCKLVSFLKVYPNAESTQANILVDSTHRARLADFGLATAIDESIPGSSTNHDGVGGTLRWMAPEVLYPNKFGFARGSKKVLPSRSTDVYAFGMTILEVGAVSCFSVFKYLTIPWIGHYRISPLQLHASICCYVQCPPRGPTGQTTLRILEPVVRTIGGHLASRACISTSQTTSDFYHHRPSEERCQ